MTLTLALNSLRSPLLPVTCLGIKSGLISLPGHFHFGLDPGRRLGTLGTPLDHQPHPSLVMDGSISAPDAFLRHKEKMMERALGPGNHSELGLIITRMIRSHIKHNERLKSISKV